MTIAGLIRETREGYTTTTNVEEALRDELKDSGCDERAALQRERHYRERKAYAVQKNEKTETEPDTLPRKSDTPPTPKIAPVEEPVAVEQPIHELGCECDDCLIPEPRYARLWRSPRVAA